MKTLFIAFAMCMFTANAFPQQIGVFDGQDDVGKILHKGGGAYNSETGAYEVSASGTNIWFTHDDFHFVWKKMKGDFILQCRGKLVGKGVEQHRKFGWMIRNTLDSTSPMIAATIHGDGLTSLQYRKAEKTNVEEIRFGISGPDVIQLERRGRLYIMSVAHFGELYVTQQTDSVDLNDDVYVGLFVCSHNKDVVEKASFENVRIIIPAKDSFQAYKEYIGSNIETMNVFTGVRKLEYTASKKSLQAPNWAHDGGHLIYNTEGLMYRLDLKTEASEEINTGKVKNNNNDHVISFDGKMLGLSAASIDGKYNSVVYTVPITGGEPKQITPIGPSYLHGWSPDGKWLTFTGQRNGEFEIYKVSAGGGEEIKLTNSPGLDDGSEYSPDGKYIYFNSVRSGHMQLYRMKPDGSEQTQLTSDTCNNWFAHVSPDNKWIVCLTFMNDVKPDEHLFYKHVYLRMMPVSGGPLKVIGYLYGGQGSINTPSWSPDSKRIAFVSNSDVSP